MPTLFISHASEDKDAFVRPLAEALKADFSVWYDEYEIHVGDSLRGRIDDGLRRCDFGVVVLSKSFFQKNWTQSELDGLLALEKANRKLILPVWYQVTKEEVAQYSPMLAGRLAANGDKGVDYVLNQLKAAIVASERTREVEPFSHSKQALKNVVESLTSKDFQKEFFWTPQGVVAVSQAAESIVTSIGDQIEAAQNSSRAKRFQVESNDKKRIDVYGPYKVCLMAQFVQLAQNMVEDSFFIGQVYLRANGPFRGKGEMLQEFIFRPRCLSKGSPISWVLDGEKQPRDLEQVVAALVERFCVFVLEQEEISTQQRF